MKRLKLLIVSAIVFATFVTVFFSGTASADTYVPYYPCYAASTSVPISDNDHLDAPYNDYVLSCDPQGDYVKLVMQSDGNLVLYDSGVAKWSTGTANRSTAYAIMQSDGNFVLYDTNHQSIWSSNTAGNPHAQLIVQTDGNVVIKTTSGNVIWATNTSQ